MLWGKLREIAPVLGALALLIGVMIALPIGVYSAIRQDTMGDFLTRSFSILLLAIPSFWLGTMVVVVPSIYWGWSPPVSYITFHEDPWGNLRSFLLPALTLGFGEYPVLMRVLRSDMIATLQEDYIAMAKAKGLRPARILFLHALKPSSLTLVTVAGINIGRLIGGALIVESIFALPGIGRLLVGSIYARDFIIMQGVVLFVAAAFVIVNFIVDMLYALLDPRIRHGRA